MVIAIIFHSITLSKSTDGLGITDMIHSKGSTILGCRLVSMAGRVCGLIGLEVVVYFSVYIHTLLGGVNQSYSRLTTTHGPITDCKFDSVVYAGACV